MKAPDFDYLRPPSLAVALGILADHDGDAMPLAGGQSLMPMMNFRLAAPAALVDLADVAELQGITRIGDVVRIGAMTRYATLADDPIVQADVPLIGMALPHIAHEAIRNRGTIGGSLALADPAAEMPALMLALDAVIVVAGLGGQRKIAADELFVGVYETTLAENELIVAIEIPVRPDGRFGFYELTQRHGDYALAGVALASGSDGWRAAFFGVADRAMRVPALEAALAGGTDVMSALPHLSEIPFTDDVKASAATRQRLAGVALQRAIAGMAS